MLKAVAPDVKPVPNYGRHQWSPWDAYIYTADPDGLFDEYSANDVLFHKPLHNNSDNLRGFEIQDADGYVLFFGIQTLSKMRQWIQVKTHLLKIKGFWHLAPIRNALKYL